MTAGAILAGRVQFITASGTPAVGGSVYTYLPNTTTQVTTYADSAQTVPNSNPIILDSLGSCTMFYSGILSQVVYDQFGSLIWSQLVQSVGSTSTVTSRLSNTFAPGPGATAMNVVLAAGHVFNPTVPILTEIAAQTVVIAAAPGTGTSRIDRVVVNAASGIASVVPGNVATIPTAPAIPAGTCPVAQVLVAAGTLAITSTMITDERDLTGLGILTVLSDVIPKSAPITSYYSGTGAIALTISADFGIGYLEYDGGAASTVSLPASAGILSIVNNNSGSMALSCSGTFVNLGPFGTGTGGASASLPSGQSALLEWTGTGWNAVGGSAAIGGSSGSTVSGAFKNLTASATGTSAVLVVTADELVVENALNQYLTLRSVFLIKSTGAASGAANSLDTGSWAYSTWYNTFVIYGTAGTALLWSLSATAPTLPTGYAYFARVGTIRTQSATNYYPLGFTQKGRRVQYLVGAGNVPNLPMIASGAGGSLSTPTYVTAAWGAYAPPTIAAIKLLLYNTNPGIIVVPNLSYGAYVSSTNPPLLQCGGSGNGNMIVGEIIPESSNLYWASGGGTISYFCCVGWEDNL